MICQHCKEPVRWDADYNMWEHKRRSSTFRTELCEPAKGDSTQATPTFGE